MRKSDNSYAKFSQRRYMSTGVIPHTTVC